MIVEERRGRDGGSRAPFPVGMSVLAVDDDPTCLKLLETLLVRCQYHVTATNQAITALKMLREKRDRFDLVISDVHMPDMDGFKLLELVGLEMDLPVIMLSANGETKTVMKGITHGAVDYLLKPVRIEELKNIWQHVIRRKKFDRRDWNSSDYDEDFDKTQHANSEGVQDTANNGSSDLNWKLNRKRKDQTDDDEDYYEENENENEDPSTQKKPRVVWSVELHRKFVAAVNQLGIDKAVPKRILDLMNVEKLSRENVASHLQKYRLYLKRLSAVASQQANMVVALGGRDLTYLPMYSMDGFGSFHSLATSGQQPALSSYQPNGVLNTTNPAALGVEVLARSGMVHFGHTQNSTGHLVNDLRKIQHYNLQGNRHGNLLQGMPVSLELDKFQHQKRIHETTSHLPIGLPASGLINSSSSNSFVNAMDNPLLLQGQQQHTGLAEIDNHSSLGTPSIASNSLMSTGVSSFSADLGRCNDTWQSAVPLNCHTFKTLPMSAPGTEDDLAYCIKGTYATPVISEADRNIPNISSSSHDVVVRRDGHCQPNSIGQDTVFTPISINEDSKFLNFRSTGHSRQKWEEPKAVDFREPGLLFNSSLNYPPSSHTTADLIAENQRLDINLSNERIDTNMTGQSSCTVPFSAQSCKIDKSTSDGQMKYMDFYNLETPKLISGFNLNGCNYNDLVNVMIKTEQDDISFVEGDMEYDIFPLGACM